MGAFASLTASLNLDTKNFTKNLRNATEQVKTFNKSFHSGTQNYGSKIVESTKGLNTSLQKMHKNYKGLNDGLFKHLTGLKDVARITQGIMISQAFYRVANAIQEATNELLTFNESLDYATVTYTALFGSADISHSFLETLKNQSIETIFSFEDLTEASKKLLAHGINYRNLGFITEGLTNLATMSGDASAIDRISRALGQIYTRGKLSAEEMRQLANAYVPIYEIIQSKFGLTSEQMGSVGDLNLPAHEVINAIIDYANEQFGAVGDAAVGTITGLKNKIVDSVKVVGVEMLAPFTQFYKSFLSKTADVLATVRGQYEKFGAGGVFEYLVPNEETQQLIRQFLANTQNLFLALMRIITAIMPAVATIAGGFAEAFNILAPLLKFVLNLLAATISVVTSNEVAMQALTGALVTCAAAWALYRLNCLRAFVMQALTKVTLGLAKAVMFLATALIKHPIVTMFGLLAAALLGVAVASTDAKGKLAGFFDKLTGLGGEKTSEDVLQLKDAMEETSDDSERFNERLTESADAMDELDNAAKKAKRGLLSFDEVFKLNEKADKDDEFELDGLLDGLNGMGENIDLGIPDFSEYANKFVSGITGSLYEALKRMVTGASVGGLIGGLVGFTIGGLVTGNLKGAFAGAKWGAKIGAVAGGAIMTFWEDGYKNMEGAIKKITMGGTSGALLGGLAGLVIGAFATKNLMGALEGAKYGAIIGTFLGTALGAFWAGAKGSMSNAIAGLVANGAGGALLGGLAGFVLGAFVTKTLPGALAGAKYGAAIGSALGVGLSGFFDTAETTIKDKFSRLFSSISAASRGMMIGALVGGVLGAVLGAFAGGAVLPFAKAGAAFGMMAGGLIELLVSELQAANAGEKVGNWFKGIGDNVATVAGNILGWVKENWGALLHLLVSPVTGALHLLYNNNPEFQAWVNDLGAKISDGFSKLGTSIGNWVDDTKQKFENWKVENKLKFDTWKTDTLATIEGWKAENKLKFDTWKTETLTSIDNWKTENKAKFDNWKTETLTAIDTWKTENKAKFDTWKTETSATIEKWKTDNKAKFNTWKTDTLASIEKWKTDTKTKLSAWYSDTTNQMSRWVTDTKASLKNWWSGIWSTSNWASGWSRVKEWFNSLLNSISNWFSNLKTNIGNWWDNLWSNKKASVDISTNSYGGSVSLSGHATGGVFNREHIARFAEGNKAEAIIPLENQSAMQPFVDAVSNGLLASLMPAMAYAGGGSTQDTLPPMYVGTLIADEAGLKELERKMRVIRLKEEKRGNG